MPLTDLKIQAIKADAKPLKLVDGDSLYLYVTPAATKSWRIDYRFGGKRYTYTIGKYPMISLAKARIKRSEIKQMLLDGINPSADKKEKKESVRAINEDTFQGIATEWYNSKLNMRSDAWRHANKLYLERDLCPALGKLGIRAITPQLLLTTLENCASQRGYKTADRVRGTAMQVFEHAIIKLKADANPAARIKNWAEIPAAKNRPHLSELDIHNLIETMGAYSGLMTTKIAAKLLLLTFVRKMEILEATWDEFDLKNAKWIIPASRMKMKEAHFVPLSTQALEALEQLKEYSSGSRYLFPKFSTILKPISRTTLNRMFAEMGDKKYKGKFSPHGIRATASTWLNERGWRADVIERQLAHSERNQIRASYNHADYVQERRQMLQSWADFLFPSIPKPTTPP